MLEMELTSTDVDEILDDFIEADVFDVHDLDDIKRPGNSSKTTVFIERLLQKMQKNAYLHLQKTLERIKDPSTCRRILGDLEATPILPHETEGTCNIPPLYVYGNVHSREIKYVNTESLKILD